MENADRNKIKLISNKDVLFEALELFDNSNENTATSLEVKENLRSKGFYATQTQVSKMMLVLANRYGWNYQKRVSVEENEYLQYSWSSHQRNNFKNRISIFYWKNEESITTIIIIVEIIFLVILLFQTFQWFSDPENNKYEPLIGLIASILAIFQWSINRLR